MCTLFSVVVFNDSCVERDGLIGEKTEGGMLLVERVKAACSVINSCERTESEKLLFLSTLCLVMKRGLDFQI